MCNRPRHAVDGDVPDRKACLHEGDRLRVACLPALDQGIGRRASRNLRQVYAVKAHRHLQVARIIATNFDDGVGGHGLRTATGTREGAHHRMIQRTLDAPVTLQHGYDST